MKKIAVLMCTYNGEKYLKEQIDSIQNQKGVSVFIYVRDDGSKDKTIDILEEYQQKGGLKWFRCKNVGPAVGFMELLYQTARNDFDYFAFSDQDDIWLETKLLNATEKIEMCADEKFILYGANQTFLKGDIPTSNVYNEMPILNTPYLLDHNKIAGCTIVINRELAILIKESSHIDAMILKSRMHDLWLVLVASTCGKIVFDMNPTMLYRIHEHNVVGETDTSFKARIRRLWNDSGERSNSRSKYAKELLRCFGDHIKSEERHVLELYASYRYSRRRKREFLYATEIIKRTGENTVAFRIKILLNYI